MDDIRTENFVENAAMFFTSRNPQIDEILDARGKMLVVLMKFLRKIGIRRRLLIPYFLPEWYYEYKIFLDFLPDCYFNKIISFILAQDSVIESTQKDELDYTIKHVLANVFHYTGSLNCSLVDFFVKVHKEMPENHDLIVYMLGDFVDDVSGKHKFYEINRQSYEFYSVLKSPITLEFVLKSGDDIENYAGGYFKNENVELEEFLEFLRNMHKFYNVNEIQDLKPSFALCEKYKIESTISSCLEFINQLTIAGNYSDEDLIVPLKNVTILTESKMFQKLLTSKLAVTIVNK